LGDGPNGTVMIENDGAGAGRALVKGEDGVHGATRRLTNSLDWGPE
jgi:hypothetical protein